MSLCTGAPPETPCDLAHVPGGGVRARPLGLRSPLLPSPRQGPQADQSRPPQSPHVLNLPPGSCPGPQQGRGGLGGKSPPGPVRRGAPAVAFPAGPTGKGTPWARRPLALVSNPCPSRSGRTLCVPRVSLPGGRCLGLELVSQRDRTRGFVPGPLGVAGPRPLAPGHLLRPRGTCPAMSLSCRIPGESLGCTSTCQPWELSLGQQVGPAQLCPRAVCPGRAPVGLPRSS